jgi:hypothetical protein
MKWKGWVEMSKQEGGVRLKGRALRNRERIRKGWNLARDDTKADVHPMKDRVFCSGSQYKMKRRTLDESVGIAWTGGPSRLRERLEHGGKRLSRRTTTCEHEVANLVPKVRLGNQVSENGGAVWGKYDITSQHQQLC